MLNVVSCTNHSRVVLLPREHSSCDKMLYMLNCPYFLQQIQHCNEDMLFLLSFKAHLALDKFGSFIYHEVKNTFVKVTGILASSCT